MNLSDPALRSEGKGDNLVPGMVFTIEPMINLGKKDLHILADNWTAVTTTSPSPRNSNRPSWSRKKGLKA